MAVTIGDGFERDGAQTLGAQGVDQLDIRGEVQVTEHGVMRVELPEIISQRLFHLDDELGCAIELCG